MEQDSTLELDATNVYQEAIGEEQGLSRDALEDLARRFVECHRRVEQMRGKEAGFMELPYDRDLVSRIKKKAAELRGWCKNFVVLGIGGSALGSIAIHSALNHTFHNLLPEEHPARQKTPRVFVLDNVDPALMSEFLDVINEQLDRTVFNVITKSGATAETMSQFLLVRDWLRREGCDPSKHIIATTDPSRHGNILHPIAQEEGLFKLIIPPKVGGRFSVLSAVGLLSAAVGGVEIEEMLDGAAAMDRRCRAATLEDNPAALYAAILYLFYGKGKPITVLMPYSNGLRRLADWYCQLWAESLGKQDGLSARDVFVGPTPVAAVGVTDQHSVMQLYLDGPFDKVITLVEVGDLVSTGQSGHVSDLRICRGGSERELAHLAEATFAALFRNELAATRRALTEKHRPNLTVRIPAVSARTLGELFMFFQYAVTYSGCLYDVDPFNEPAVGLIRQYTGDLMVTDPPDDGVAG